MRKRQEAGAPLLAAAIQRGCNTNLASEFYVLSMLYRLGFDANLTLSFGLASQPCSDLVASENARRLRCFFPKSPRAPLVCS